MRYRFVVLMLFAVLLPTSMLKAAPVPDPVAVLDIGPPTHGETMEEHMRKRIHVLTSVYGGYLGELWRETDVGKLERVAAFADPRPWLSKNLQLTPIPGTSRLRLRFRAGSRAEQVLILNSLLRIEMRFTKKYWQGHESTIHEQEERLAQLTKDGYPTERLQAAMAERRAIIAAAKQIAVIQWAK